MTNTHHHPNQPARPDHPVLARIVAIALRAAAARRRRETRFSSLTLRAALVACAAVDAAVVVGHLVRRESPGAAVVWLAATVGLVVWDVVVGRRSGWLDRYADEVEAGKVPAESPEAGR